MGKGKDLSLISPQAWAGQELSLLTKQSLTHLARMCGRLPTCREPERWRFPPDALGSEEWTEEGPGLPQKAVAVLMTDRWMRFLNI